MPPSSGRAVQSVLRDAFSSFICPSCAFSRSLTTNAFTFRCRRLPQPSPRHASTVASATAINAPIDVPIAFRDLYESLRKLKIDAAIYTNFSRLQLALRGLEGRNAVVRVAVLSSGSPQLARQLARLLVADPLEQERKWEKQLDNPKLSDGRAVLIRYGDENSPPPLPNPLFQTILVPSQFLRKHNLELLLSTISLSLSPHLPNAPDPSTAQDALLVPTLSNAAIPQQSPITFPVHKTLLLGPSPETLIEYGRFIRAPLPPTILKIAITIPTHRAAEPQSPSALVAAIDIPLAAHALASFRQSLDNAVAYERGWYASGLEAVAEWVAEGAGEEGKVKPAVAELVESVLDGVEGRIKESEKRGEVRGGGSVPGEVREKLVGEVEAWAERAHGELRDGLGGAFGTGAWRRLSWWRLIWRVDDVGFVCNEVLERRWLMEAEREVIYLAGRISQAGLLQGAPASSVSTAAPTSRRTEEKEEEEAYGALWSTPPPPTLGDIVDVKAAKDSDIDGEILPPPPPTSQPWPSHIQQTRYSLSRTTVPSLQALGQSLLLQALSITALTGAISALAYISVSTTTIYEAGAVVAFGVVWSMRRVQKKWEQARKFWEGEVREEGRVALKETEESLRTIIQTGGRAESIDEDSEQRNIAKKAVEEAREALERVKG